MDDRQTKAFDFAQETTKQLLTLATGVLALTITFLKDITKNAPHSAQKWLHIAWILYLASAVFGVFTLSMLSGNLAKRDEPDIYAWNIRGPSIAQYVTFLVAIGFTINFGIKAL